MIYPISVREALCVIEVMQSAEEKLPKVRRWGAYFEKGRCREQNSLQHSYSITWLVDFVLDYIGPILPTLDRDLLLKCAMVHDHGEGEIGYDTLDHQKNSRTELEEYEAFVDRYSVLPVNAFEARQRAFLLQFCLQKDISHFPAYVQNLITDLKNSRLMEARLFRAIECFDYVLYALAQFDQQQNKFLLVGVLYGQKDFLRIAAQTIPGFRVFWSEEIHAWAEKFIADNPEALKEFLEVSNL